LLVNSAIVLPIAGSGDSGYCSLEAKDFLASLDGTLAIEELAIDLVNLKVLYLPGHL
jgi:hypothetical protein